MKLEDLLDMDMVGVIGWLEDNAHKFDLVPKGCEEDEGLSEDEKKLNKVEVAIQTYHRALDAREQGCFAQDKAFNEICTALDMHWQRS